MTGTAGRADRTAGPVVVVDGLRIRYTSRTPAVLAADDVSFSIEPGQCLGLVGESGSGKSTIGSALQGLLTREPGVEADGDVRIEGRHLSVTDEAGWSSVRGSVVSTVFQDPMTSLDPTMTIGRALASVAGKRDACLRWLEEVEIRNPAAVLRSYPHQLSGGMRQRVMIALALARGPKLLIADEPTTALDVSVQQQVLRLIDRERERLGFAVLFITHDLGVARAVSDDVAVMQRGKIVEQRSAASVFDNPQHDYTRRLVGSRLTMTTDRARPIGPPEDSVLRSMRESLAERGDAVQDLAAAWSEGTLTWERFERPIESGAPALDFRGVSKSFRTGSLISARKEVLRSLDLRVGRGESVALVGESGSGKSTILRIAAGLERPDSGTVTAGSDRDDVQVVFQDAGASLTPWLTVGQILRERLDNARPGLGDTAAQEQLRTALERVALPIALLDARAGELSGGQRQRVAIARAIVVPPALLLCDEPTSALDVSVACVVLNLISLLRRELGTSVLFVTHDLASARLIADRVDVISAGRIVESVPGADLTTSITSDHGRKLLDAVLA